MALVIETITCHTEHQAIGLYRVDMDELVTLAVPQTMAGALRIT